MNVKISDRKGRCDDCRFYNRTLILYTKVNMDGPTTIGICKSCLKKGLTLIEEAENAESNSSH